jgi:NAD(P)H-hydrate repair Nnr-like enzyme with NAD(P)H-hydrate epimerase domain
MTMPIEGSYASVRAWLAQLLNEPALSIDNVDLQRGDVMSDQVKARVTVSLWWRKQERARP